MKLKPPFKKIYFLIFSLIFTCLFPFGSEKAFAECLGKIELGPAYVHLNIIDARETIKRLNIPAVRADLCYDLGKGAGWLLKSNILYGRAGDGELTTASIGFGRCIPIKQRWTITPLIGISYTDLSATISLNFGGLGRLTFTERFQGVAPYLGMEVYYKIASNLRLCLSGQYAWSQSKIEVKPYFSIREHSEGPSYGAMIEYDLNKCWSVNFGGAYNASYSKEKDGICAGGLKLGIVRWF